MIVRLESATLTSLYYDPEIITKSIELNHFVFVNHKAMIRKIIKKHDKNVSQCRFMPVWYYWNLGKTFSLLTISVLSKY